MNNTVKWILISLVLTVLLNVSLNAFAEEQITCERIIENVTVNYEKQISDLLNEIVTRCDTAQGEVLEFEQDGKVVTIMCWKVQLL